MQTFTVTSVRRVERSTSRYPDLAYESHTEMFLRARRVLERCSSTSAARAAGGSGSKKVSRGFSAWVPAVSERPESSRLTAVGRGRGEPVWSDDRAQSAPTKT